MEEDEYSAILQGPRNTAEYCPNCGEKNSIRLCRKCRDAYVCDDCSFYGVCKSCSISCSICYSKAICGDCLDDVCEECEIRISSIQGQFTDSIGESHRNMLDLIMTELHGIVVPDVPIDEDLIDYLNEIGITIVDHDGD